MDQDCFNYSSSRHNMKILNNQNPPPPPPPCRCRNLSPLCPNQCKTQDVVYLCRVTPPNNQNMETYTGLTSQTFKKRWDQHMSDCRRGEGTTLASHIGELKAKGIDVDLITHLHWSIKKNATPFNPVSNQCMLCLREKYFILHEPWDASLNKRT